MPTPTIVFDDSPRARRTDPTTSHEAADSISREGREDSEIEVLAILRAAPRPLSAEQIQEHHEARAFIGQAARPYSQSRLRTALKQLADDGIVAVDPTIRAKTRTGRSAQVWALTERGAA